MTRIANPLRLGALLAAAALSGCGVHSDLPSGRMAYGVIPPGEKAPVAGHYALGPSDTLKVFVFREPDLSLESVQIDPAGNLVLPLIGAVRAQGMSPEQLSRHIEERLLRYVNHPQVAVTVVETGGSIAVEGAVNKPGVYPVRGRSTLIEALAMGGSPSNYADNDRVFVFRTIDGRSAGARFDIRRIRAGIDPDPLILPGDRVVVGTSGIKEAWLDYLSAPLFNVFRIF